MTVSEQSLFHHLPVAFSTVGFPTMVPKHCALRCSVTLLLQLAPHSDHLLKVSLCLSNQKSLFFPLTSLVLALDIPVGVYVAKVGLSPGCLYSRIQTGPGQVWRAQGWVYRSSTCIKAWEASWEMNSSWGKRGPIHTNMFQGQSARVQGRDHFDTAQCLPLSLSLAKFTGMRAWVM